LIVDLHQQWGGKIPGSLAARGAKVLNLLRHLFEHLQVRAAPDKRKRQPSKVLPLDMKSGGAFTIPDAPQGF
jgi:hypothetical protein